MSLLLHNLLHGTGMPTGALQDMSSGGCSCCCMLSVPPNLRGNMLDHNHLVHVSIAPLSSANAVQMDMRVMGPTGGFDEGADAEQWQHWGKQ